MAGAAIERSTDPSPRQYHAGLQPQPFKPGEERARILGRLGGLAYANQLQRRKQLVAALEEGLGDAITVALAQVRELGLKLRAGKRLTRREQSDLRWWGELLARHCKGVLPQEIIAQVTVTEAPPSLSAAEVLAMRVRWEQVQAGGLLGEDGRPQGAPEDYIEGEVVGEGSEEAQDDG